MIVQNVLYGDGEMYLRVSGEVRGKGNCIRVARGGIVSTDTYMNAFDIGTWKKYTLVETAAAILSLRGSGKIRMLYCQQGGHSICIEEKQIDNFYSVQDDWAEFKFDMPGSLVKGIVYFEFEAEEDTNLRAWYTIGSKYIRNIKISLVICTYQRRRQLEALIDIFRQSGGDAEGWLRVRIVDNASEITGQYGSGIEIYHNPNTGGSGGFARGMEETLKGMGAFPATHVVLMDDDAVLQMESLYRLHAILALMRDSYQDEVVAGRMFRLDKPYVQYTAAEIWNKGDIRHIGWNQTMTEKDCLWKMNENQDAEYSGWWFACFPVEYIRNNRPLPFFLHCDDVEYGLRHGGTPILLNGIQVWHESYENRQPPVMAYYDCRNSLFVNSLYAFLDWRDVTFWKRFKGKITEAHNREDYLREYFIIRAYRDYLRGYKWFIEKNDIKIHNDLVRRKKVNRYINSVRWRRVGVKLFVKKLLCR